MRKSFLIAECVLGVAMLLGGTAVTASAATQPALRAVHDPGRVTGTLRGPCHTRSYGQHNVQGELDHLVPLELGGSNDLSNLWVEAGHIPNPKDSVENRLHREVCSGKISLHTAQVDIAHDWMTAP